MSCQSKIENQATRSLNIMFREFDGHNIRLLSTENNSLLWPIYRPTFLHLFRTCQGDLFAFDHCKKNSAALNFWCLAPSTLHLYWNKATKWRLQIQQYPIKNYRCCTVGVCSFHRRCSQLPYNLPITHLRFTPRSLQVCLLAHFIKWNIYE